MGSLVEQANLLVGRLERLSPDSSWARRAAGLRVSLARLADLVQQGRKNPDRLQRLVDEGFEILEKAAREIPDPKEKKNQA
ncbi:MAG: hypothetical protein FJZ96_02810 [Chloroflexi bacterium]|nr:hypothetical protein [Chloroflexota bacterium]